MTSSEFKKSFAVFILSHGRANEMLTVGMLEKYHYTGDWYVVIDDEDEQEPIYRQKYGEHILQFCKIDEANKTDTGDLDNDRRVGVFARNAIQDLAEQLGYQYHLQLDDDFRAITFRYVDGNRIASKKCEDLDSLFFAMVRYLDSTNISWLSFALSSDYLGGIASKRYNEGLLPKTMGSFLMRANDKVRFNMRMNDDITTCVMSWMRGKPNYSVTYTQVETPPTQHMKGGMTDIYQDNGTYRKSFYSVMCCPSAVKIAKQGIKNYRIHHKIEWNNCRPKVLDEKWKKKKS